MIGQCCKCRKSLMRRLPGGDLAFSPEYVYPEPELRLNTLQNKRVPICRTCFATLTPDDFPTITAYLKELHGHAAALSELSAFQVASEQPDLARWAVIGFAHEIPGLEHGVRRPTERVCGRCGRAGVEDLVEPTIGREPSVQACCLFCGPISQGEVSSRQGFVTREQALAP